MGVLWTRVVPGLSELKPRPDPVAKVRFVKVNVISALTKSKMSVKTLSAKEDFPGKCFLIVYVTDRLGTMYHAPNHWYRLVHAEGKELDALGERIGSKFSEDGVDEATGGPFEIMTQTTYQMSQHTKCLSIVFLVPQEFNSGKLLHHKDSAWKEIAPVSVQ